MWGNLTKMFCKTNNGDILKYSLNICSMSICNKIYSFIYGNMYLAENGKYIHHVYFKTSFSWHCLLANLCITAGIIPSTMYIFYANTVKWLLKPSSPWEIITIKKVTGLSCIESHNKNWALLIKHALAFGHANTLVGLFRRKEVFSNYGGRGKGEETRVPLENPRCPDVDKCQVQRMSQEEIWTLNF